MSVRRSAWLASVLFAAAAVAVSAASGAHTATTHVAVGGPPPGGFTFEPDSVTINAGDTVQWDWAGGTHTVTSGDPGTCAPSAGFDSGIQSSGTFSHTFPTPGTYTYICELHCGTGMTGQVIVNGPTGAALRALTASVGAAGVVVRWRTTSEVGVLGFHVFRGGIRVTRSPIAAAGRAGGASYSFRDLAGKAGARYRLQVLHPNGVLTWSGTAVIAI
jgi:plastocyanin